MRTGLARLLVAMCRVYLRAAAVRRVTGRWPHECAASHKMFEEYRR